MELLVTGLVFPEGPRYREGKLWVSDMHDQRVITVDASGAVEEVVHVEGMPSGLGFLDDGSLLIVSMRDRRLLRFAGGQLSEVADLSELASFHCNDMLVDAEGRAYIGNFGFDLDAGATPSPAELVLVAPGKTPQVVAKDLMFPNGMVLLPDGRTLVVGETFGGCLTAFDVAEDGSLSGRRVWAQLDGAVPDGICLDAEDAIWVASPTSKEFLRVRQGGEVLDRLICEQRAIACMLGGDDGQTLYCLTAPHISPRETRAARTGRIFTHRAPAPAAGLP